MKSCTEHYIVTDVVPSDEGCAPHGIQTFTSVTSSPDTGL